MPSEDKSGVAADDMKRTASVAPADSPPTPVLKEVNEDVEMAHKPDTAIDIGESAHGLDLQFRDVKMSVRLPEDMDGKENRKQILNGLSGYARPNELTAIIGASGAGKTTLLNVLARRTTGREARVTGEVLVGGDKIATDVFQDLSAYIMQSDILMETFTVREALSFSAALRLPRTLSEKEKEARVDRIIEDLGLSKCANTIIGSDLVRGVSGGERKRVSIGVELVTDPSLLFVDEPTSGLDSHTAMVVVEKLKALAKRSRTVLCTIHQPSSEIFHMFDQLILLVGGCIVYQGRADAAVHYFNTIGFECPQYSNPADFFMKVLNVDCKNPEVMNRLVASYNKTLLPDIVKGREPEIQKDHKESDEKEANGKEKAANVEAEMNKEDRSESTEKQPDGTEAANHENGQRKAENGQHKAEKEPAAKRQVDTGKSVQSVVELVSSRPPGANMWTQMMALSRRSILNYQRQPLLLRVRLGQMVFLGIFIGILYWDLGTDQTSIQDRNGLLFMLCVTNLMTSALSVVLTFPAERSLFEREYKSNMYTLESYMISKFLSELPFQLLFPLIYSAIVYPMVGFQAGWDKYWIFYTATMIMVNVGQGLGMFLGAVIPTAEAAVSAAPMAIIPFMLFAGFMVNLDSITVWLRWLQWLSPFKYGYEVIAVNEYDGLELFCTAEELANFGPGAVCPLTRGDQVLSSLSLDKDQLVRGIWALLLLMIGFRLLSYIALKWRISRK